jgi:hypothetical protein
MDVGENVILKTEGFENYVSGARVRVRVRVRGSAQCVEELERSSENVYRPAHCLNRLSTMSNTPTVNGSTDIIFCLHRPPTKA